MEQRKWTTKEAAEALKVDETTVQRWCRLGQVRWVNLRSGPPGLRPIYGIPDDEMQAMLKTRAS